MPRRPHIDLLPVTQHVVQRSDRRPCFFTTGDNVYYRRDLREIALRDGCETHAYVLMTNHVHLLMTPNAVGQVARIGQALGRRYVRYVIDGYHRTKKGDVCIANVQPTPERGAQKGQRKLAPS